jgi:mono/diheme cytochrome c family protein/uncharacterized membrane protein
LLQEFDELRRQQKALDAAPPRPVKPSPSAAKGPAEASGVKGIARGAGTLYREHCRRCHGADGTGQQREAPEGVPDFTRREWQEQRSDAQLLRGILDGKGKEMPPWREKVSEEQARGLVAYVRAFAPASQGPGPDGRQKPPPDNLEERYRRLQEGLDELQKQLRQLPQVSPDREPPRPCGSPPGAAPPPPAPVATVTPTARDLFRQHCAKCHEADGTGSRARRRHPGIPDFTDTSWQAGRGDAQLGASILDGKGKEMPSFRGQVSDEQARGLVTYVRTFAAAADRPGAEEEVPTPAEPAEAEPPSSFLGKLILWLGQSHPPAVHFPIGLLTAAAVAELLRRATRRPAFDAVARYCVWFGTLTAAVAGALGWLLGGPHLTDASGVLTAHRWLGTATVAWAALVLVLTEVSCRTNRPGVRLWSRLALLVVAVLVLVTGFFGGAVVYGLGHYAWPQ